MFALFYVVVCCEKLLAFSHFIFSARYWADRQRRAKRNEAVRASGKVPKGRERISSTQIARLESIGFEWTATERNEKGTRPQWMEKFKLFQEFVSKHGHTRVPRKPGAACGQHFAQLGTWIKNQRAAYRNEACRARGAYCVRSVCGGTFFRLQTLWRQLLVGETPKGLGRLTSRQITLLESVPGFCWEPSSKQKVPSEAENRNVNGKHVTSPPLQR